ncbi:biopolymer transporter ExbD [Leptolyngbya sp. BC1307]|uniref:ExbD/TolR family protein n=1 Tax=Leptolyngbya sp. BC1307 TaxID=2029589 RepID=UPI000EFBE4D9|nr:biopolymer transporter ExbD [Leptolyngbya sp. BC1307]
MKVDLDSRPSDVQIEILPMIDVIFCILTFFILAAVGLTRQQAIELDLPAVNSSSPIEGNSSDRLYVSVDSSGQVYVDKSAVPLGLLYDVLVQHQQIAPNGTIVLYASRSARYEDVIQVLDLLRSVGGNRVALATLPSDTSLDPTQGSTSTLEDVLRDQGTLSPQDIPPGSNGLDPTLPTDGQPAFPNGLPPISPSAPTDPFAPPAPDPNSPQPVVP